MSTKKKSTVEVQFEYQQHAIMSCRGSLEVPRKVVDNGDKAIKQYCLKHELECDCLDYDLIEWLDHVEDSLEIDYVYK